jgi:transcriptional regulator with XRE-family HTH domain
MNGIYNKIVGLQMKQLRQDLGITQQEVADRCGLKRQTIDNVENARFDVGIGTINTILRAMGAELNIRILSEIVRITWIDSRGESLYEAKKTFSEALQSIKNPAAGYNKTLMNGVAVRIDGKYTKAMEFFEENQEYLDNELKSNREINNIIKQI